ncbi:MAG: ABC transporter ATP-binding protein [Chloroflexia bacterium]
MATAAAFDLKKTLSQNHLLGLWRMMAGFRWTYLGATLSLGVAAVAKTSTFWLLRYLVDDVLGRGRGGMILLYIALGFLGLALVEGTFTFLSGKLAAQTAEGIARRLRNYLFDHIQRLSFTYHDHMPTGELIQRCTSDVDTIRRFFADQAINAGRILILFAVNLAALLSLNVPLTLLSLAIIPVIIGVSVVFFRQVSRVYESYQEQEAVLSTTLQENLTGVRVVKAFARQDYERKRFDAQNWAKFLRGRRLISMHALYWPVSDALCGIQMLAGFAVGALMTIQGTITLGTYLAYSGMVLWIIWPMRNLARLIVQMSTGLVSYGRVAEIIRQDREPLEEGRFPPEGDLRGEIVFRNVCFEYEADAPVLKDVSFRCAPGQVVALLGSTGSGKTTVVNLLPRFYDYTGGSITLDGVELRDYPRHYLRRQIGIVEQEPFLFSRTIRENITYGVEREVSQEEVEAAARAAAIHDEIMSFPQGYDTLLGERGITLSGGQKQRVAIARTLLKDPRILILDDSTSAVDTETEMLIRQALERLMQGRTTLIIAHRIQTVMNADLILVFDRGRIVQQGKHEELLREAGPYRQIYELQTRIEAELEEEVSGVGVV